MVHWRCVPWGDGRGRVKDALLGFFLLLSTSFFVAPTNFVRFGTSMDAAIPPPLSFLCLFAPISNHHLFWPPPLRT